MWATALKHPAGLTRLWPSVIGIAIGTGSLLSVALRGLPVGTAYAGWVVIGTVGVAMAGVILFGESLSPARLIFLALIVLGVVGLKLVEQ